jgi:signal transduction histidine kinase
MDFAIAAVAYVINSVFLAFYFYAFLSPKKVGRFAAALIMSVTYFALQLLSDYPFVEMFSESLVTWFRVELISVLLFGLSFALYRRETGKQVFLLCSFFVTTRISISVHFYATKLTDSVRTWFTEMITGKLLTVPSPENVEILHALITTYVVFEMFLLYLGCMTLILRGISKSFIYKRISFQQGEAFSLILPCIPPYVGALVIKAASSLPPTALLEIDRLFYALGLVLTIFLLLVMLSSVRQQQKMARLYVEAKDAAILREQVKQLHSQDESGIYAEIRGMRHDMKSHLANIRLLMSPSSAAQSEPPTELDTYLDRMSETLEQLDFAYETGNSVSDVVIHQAYLEATRNHIRFTSEFLYPSTLEIDAYDLAVILQNALENAVEACKAVSEERRFIAISSYQKGYIYFVEVSNSYAGKLVLDPHSGLPLTSKADSAGHGLGLANIRRAARKHQGDIAIQLEEKNGLPIFRLTVMLQGETK